MENGLIPQEGGRETDRDGRTADGQTAQSATRDAAGSINTLIAGKIARVVPPPPPPIVNISIRFKLGY